MEDIKFKTVVYLTALILVVVPRLTIVAVTYGLVYLYGGLDYTFIEVLLICTVAELTILGLRVKYGQIKLITNTVIEKYTTTE